MNMNLRNPIIATGILLMAVSCKQPENKMFRLLDKRETGVAFANNITLNDSINILEHEFTYNGAGVAVGDLNGDGLQDIYFCGNQVPNKLYLNKGGMHFEEVIESAHAQKTMNQWSSGVTFVDINSDGKLDIYVCNTMLSDSAKLRDLLFINQGNDSKGVPQFKEMGKEYGIFDNTQNSISTFFDYDRDGDLDLFVSVNFIDTQYPNQYRTRPSDGSSPTRDLLYRNDFDSALGHAVFHDVSVAAGIVWEGYSHSCLVHDFNEDGWPDIYVANDYLTNDILYINNHDGTFTDRVGDIMKHQSYSSMGSDIADINNDGHDDLFTVEMLPADNKRKKVNIGANFYNHYLFTDQYKYQYQYVRNVFQVWQGVNPHTGLPLFADIAFLAGVEATDWSWSPLLADLDNDGYRDLLVTNGFPKDIIDHDFGAFRKNSANFVTRQELNDMIPEVKIPNYVFRNNHDLSFTDKSKEWGLGIPSFTNGTALADLDNDGDLDIITNNINDPAFIFENELYKSDDKGPRASHYLRVDLKGPKDNDLAYGARVSVWKNGQAKWAESECVRGYLSRSESALHFGLGSDSTVDSIVVAWDAFRSSRLGVTKADQVIKLDIKDALQQPVQKAPIPQPLIHEVEPDSLGIDYVHEENDFIDFNFQKTLPHKFSQYGPGVAVGDINGDGREDMVLSSSSRFQGPVTLIQQPDGKFKKGRLPLKSIDPFKEEDLGLLLFDVDGDKDLDLYVVRGSGQHDPGSPLYQDILAINDGKGNFTLAKEALPTMTASGQNVKAADIDGDGDLDLFVGGRVAPKEYPKPTRSFLLRNDSKPGAALFTDVTTQWNSRLDSIGLVSDALFTDFDGDNKPDLVIAGEWMPLTFLHNTGHSFEEVSAGEEVDKALGWWNSLYAADLDQDGDMDYVAGNFGLNIYFKCSGKEPLHIYSKDFDKNGLYDSFISCYFPDSAGQRKEFFFFGKDDMQKQLILIRRKFEKYADYGRATVQEVFTKDEMKGVDIKEANYMSSVWVENLGGSKFKLHALPNEAQLAPVYGIQCTDVNADGKPDILLIGNDHGMETGEGKADAFNGLVLLNGGDKSFKPLPFNTSGFLVPGDARALAQVDIRGSLFLLATQNRKKAAIFKLPAQSGHLVELGREEVNAVVTFAGGKKQRFEFAYGSSFLSQSSRAWEAPVGFTTVEFHDGRGAVTRTITATK